MCELQAQECRFIFHHTQELYSWQRQHLLEQVSTIEGEDPLSGDEDGIYWDDEKDSKDEFRVKQQWREEQMQKLRRLWESSEVQQVEQRDAWTRVETLLTFLRKSRFPGSHEYSVAWHVASQGVPLNRTLTERMDREWEESLQKARERRKQIRQERDRMAAEMSVHMQESLVREHSMGGGGGAAAADAFSQSQAPSFYPRQDEEGDRRHYGGDDDDFVASLDRQARAQEMHSEESELLRGAIREEFEREFRHSSSAGQDEEIVDDVEKVWRALQEAEKEIVQLVQEHDARKRRGGAAEE